MMRRCFEFAALAVLACTPVSAGRLVTGELPPVPCTDPPPPPVFAVEELIPDTGEHPHVLEEPGHGLHYDLTAASDADGHVFWLEQDQFDSPIFVAKGDLADGTVVRFAAPLFPVFGMQFDVRTQRLILLLWSDVVADDGHSHACRLMAMDPATGHVTPIGSPFPLFIPHPQACALDDDRGSLYVIHAYREVSGSTPVIDEHEVRAYDTATGALLGTWPLPPPDCESNEYRTLSWDPVRSRLLLGKDSCMHDTTTLIALDPATGEAGDLDTIDDSMVGAAVLDPSLRRFVMIGTRNIWTLDADSGALLSSAPHDFEATLIWLTFARDASDLVGSTPYGRPRMPNPFGRPLREAPSPRRHRQ